MDFLHRTWAEIDISALIHNFSHIKKICAPAKTMAVVKADAYGHGASEIAPALQNAGADSFAVSNIEEALQLRRCGITKPILILGYTPPELATTLSENGISQAIFSEEYAKLLSDNAVKNGKTVSVHLKLDTGMGRIGFDIRSSSLTGINSAIKAFSLRGFSPDGVFTHFPVADSTDQDDIAFTNEQYERFEKAVSLIKNAGLSPEICHCCNSAGIGFSSDIHMDICRPGIILYGIAPSAQVMQNEPFLPVMTVKSVVSMVKTVKTGDTLSYGRTYKAEAPMRVATVTAGYADGYPRSLSNKGEVLLHGKRAPIIGRICMDQMLIDVSHIPQAQLGDEVILFGKELPASELAEKCGTISYEILCGISPRVPRIIIK